MPESQVESEDEDEEDIDETWITTAPSQGLLNMIDEITNQVKQTEYKDDKTIISDNMILLKALVDELGKNLYKFLTPISPIPIILGKNKCKTALNYIQNNRGENIYNDNLYDDYSTVNSKYDTYINYKTSWLSDKFEEHKQNFIQELEQFKQNLVEKVFSTFEYGDSEYCQTKSANTEKSYKEIVNKIIFHIDNSSKYPTKGKNIFIRIIVDQITKLLNNPNVKDEKQLRDILTHLSNYLQKYDSTPEQIRHYLDRVKQHLITTYGGKKRKHKKTQKGKQVIVRKHKTRKNTSRKSS